MYMPRQLALNVVVAATTVANICASCPNKRVNTTFRNELRAL